WPSPNGRCDRQQAVKPHNLTRRVGWIARSGSHAAELGRMRRLSMAKMLLYSTGSVGTGAFYAFNNFVLPPILKSFGASDLLIGLLSSTRSIEGAVIQPTVGALSDRLWTPVGRRRPFLLVGIPLSAAFFVAGAFVDNLVALALVIVLFSIFFNVAV